jgi:hypothetical protein
MTAATEWERRQRLAIRRCAECLSLLDSPAPGSAEAASMADQAARRLGHRHRFADLDLLPREGDHGPAAG